MNDTIFAAIIGAGGVVVGAIITLLGLWWQSYLQYIREEKRHIQRKKEEAYEEIANFIANHKLLEKLNKGKNTPPHISYEEFMENYRNVGSKASIYCSIEIKNSIIEFVRSFSAGSCNKKNDYDCDAICNLIRKELGIKD